jgi:broad specificity phosphatase PhoE
VLQARRLAAHLAARSTAIGPIKHVFASDLKRAVETAQAVVDAQVTIGEGHGWTPDSTAKVDGPDADAGGTPPLKLVQLPELRERDFGSAEGKKYGVGLSLAAAGAESREQMRLRVEKFVQRHLVPVLTSTDGCIVVVAHGLILDTLLRVLLARFGLGEMARLGDMKTGWSNTGYAEFVVGVGSKLAEANDDGRVGESGDRTPIPTPLSPPQQQVTLSVVGVNVLKHLEGLKKTRGGIGSAQFDKRQRTMDSFFGPPAKKPRVEPKPEEV